MPRSSDAACEWGWARKECRTDACLADVDGKPVDLTVLRRELAPRSAVPRRFRAADDAS